MLYDSTLWITLEAASTAGADVQLVTGQAQSEAYHKTVGMNDPVNYHQYHVSVGYPSDSPATASYILAARVFQQEPRSMSDARL